MAAFLCFNIMALLMHLAAVALISVARAQLQVGYYTTRCLPAEAIIQSTVQEAFLQDPTVAPGLLRMHFHDCFVNGCDASILVDGENSEKAAAPNLSLHGFEIIDDAKGKLEATCPGVVSCADILAFAARDSVVLSGGLFWQVPAGRLDGTVSLKSDPLKTLPPPSADVTKLTTLFAAQGLSQDEMVTLSGAHTIGVAHCAAFIGRLYNFSSTASVDPTMNSHFARGLQQACPQGDPNGNSAVVAMDSSPFDLFDNSYYANLINGEGLLTSDESLFTADANTREAVLENSVNNLLFQIKFTQAMIKMSSIGVNTDTPQGQVRQNCRIINPN